MTRIERTSVIDVPPEKVFAIFTDYERMPEFNKNVKEVKITSEAKGVGRITHWVYELGGSRMEFDDEATEWVENERIVWRTISGDFNASGIVTFRPVDGGTELKEVWEYKLPYSILGMILDALMVRKRMENAMDYGLKVRKEFIEKQ